MSVPVRCSATNITTKASSSNLNTSMKNHVNQRNNKHKNLHENIGNNNNSNKKIIINTNNQKGKNYYYCKNVTVAADDNNVNNNIVMNTDNVMMCNMMMMNNGNDNGWPSAEMRWMQLGGRLGTPDAAAAASSTCYEKQNHHNNNNNETILTTTTSMMTNNNNNDGQITNTTTTTYDMMMMDDNSNENKQQQQQQQITPVSPPPQQPEPEFTTENLFNKLHEYLSLEPKFQPSLYLPQESQDGEITIGARDGAAHVLRCLKVWYDIPTDVLFTAINLVDRFLTKMKVRPKHMACISVGSMHLAIGQLNLSPIDTEDLVAISQCRCTSGDLERMASIIANKLGVQMNTHPITAITFIRLFYYIFKNVVKELGLSEFYEKAITLNELENRLEILVCDANCASIRPSELALVLICTQMDAHVNRFLAETDNQQIHGFVDYAIELQKLCRIPDSSFFHSHRTVVDILSRYNGQHKMPYKQRLVWKLSSRTMRVLRPTDKLTSYLPTIEEDNINNSLALRLRTGSVSSEDGEDWPTSPVVPVYE